LHFRLWHCAQGLTVERRDKNARLLNCRYQAIALRTPANVNERYGDFTPVDTGTGSGRRIRLGVTSRKGALLLAFLSFARDANGK